MSSDNRHRLLAEHITRNMPSGLITVDRTGRISGFNPASERIFEGRLHRNSRLSELVREPRRLEDLLDRCVTNGTTFTRIEFDVPLEGGEKHIGINLSPIEAEGGCIEGVICLLSDLTEIVDLQNQIKMKENFAALGEMSAGIAHEFKNAIATILGYAQLSAREADLEQLHHYAREIQREARALSVIVTDFLNFARPVRPSLQVLDVGALMRNAISDLETLRPGNYSVLYEEASRVSVEGDETLLKQALVNLLINAAESLQGSGTISVTLQPSPNSVRISVADTGRGIAPDALKKVFLPFYTTKTNGTGLGLALVQKIVYAHNGRIDVKSLEGQGTRFEVSLPVHVSGLQSA